MQEMSAEIRGFSKYSQELIEEFEQRAVRRLRDENELYRVFLRDIGLPRDWRDTLAPEPDDE